MIITEFLKARIAEDEAQALRHQASASRHGWGDYTSRVLAECAAKRAIIKQHEGWPVLIERELEMEEPIVDFQGTVIRMHREMMWLTEREYARRFGTEPPTAPMIRTLATVYKDHPDYQAEWSA